MEIGRDTEIGLKETGKEMKMAMGTEMAGDEIEMAKEIQYM